VKFTCNYEAVFPQSSTFSPQFGQRGVRRYKIPCLDFRAYHENFVSIRCHLQIGVHVVHSLQDQTDGSRTVPGLGCEQDGKEQSIVFLRLPDVCTSWCEARHCREGEGRLSCLRMNSTDAFVSVCLKFSCSTRDVLRSRGREFYNTDLMNSASLIWLPLHLDCLPLLPVSGLLTGTYLYVESRLQASSCISGAESIGIRQGQL
jgi:hypothetical protein